MARQSPYVYIIIILSEYLLSMVSYEMIGGKLKKYWKIGIHWLTALRNILHFPFDSRAIEILNNG